MRKSRLKRGDKQMKRGAFKNKPKNKKRRVKTPLQKAKMALWEHCKRITRAKYGNTCYTCGKTGLEGSGWHTGHFISSSICSVHLRYHLDNLRLQ